MGIFFKTAAGLLFCALAMPAVAQGAASDDHGPAWLDDTDSARALRWVADQDARTLATVKPSAAFVSEAATILTDPGRVPDINFIGNDAYEYRQARDRPLGIWRRTPKAALLAGQPQWETVLDLDALSAAEGKKLIFGGASCHQRRCLVRLSENGKDAAAIREFDLDGRQFVAGGFAVPDSKSRAWWYDDDTLLVAPALDAKSVNVSLMPKTLRLWKRGTPLKAAKTLFTIGDNDAMLSVAQIRAGGADAFIAARHIDFERRAYRLLRPDGTGQPLPLPELATVLGVHAGKLLLRPNVAWTPPGVTAAFPAGALVAVPLEPLMQDARIENPECLYVPTGDDALRGVLSADGRLFVELLHDYRSRYVELTRTAAGWSGRVLPLQGDRFITALGYENGRLLLRTEAPLVPEQIVLADPTTGAEQLLYARAPQFDADRFVTEIYHTASRDGTPIAYSIMRPRTMKRDGSNPTLVYGYGGYDVPITPRYEPIFGKLWLEQGGVYVHAYLRGGGEHGPAWHRGAMQKNRQQPFDDMIAILKDLHRRGISTPATTGIIGRSNGGLMVAAVMEQAPELMNAVVVGGPLIDMLNYHLLPPGGTWLAEYGDPRDPDMAAFLRTYSPMQNIAGADVRYPVPLIITATDDDRVLPGHARRFAARLAQKGHDSLYFEDRQGGHYWELAGGPIPGDWRLRSVARAVEFSYLWRQLSGGATK